MSSIQGVSSSALSSFYEAAADTKKHAAPKVSTKFGVSVSSSGRPKASASAGVKVKSGRKTSSVTVKVNEKGKVSGSIGHEVSIPVGDGQVKLGTKIGHSDLKRLIQWLFALFGRKAEPT